MEFLKKKKFIVLLVVISALILGFFFTFVNNYQVDFLSALVEKMGNLEGPPKQLPNPPTIIKAIYVTGWSAGTKSYARYMRDIFKTTQINAVVIDIKDVSGFVSYKTGAEKAREYKNYVRAIPDINKLVRDLHNQGIYVIGRVSVFKDSALANDRPDLAVYDKSKIPMVSTMRGSSYTAESGIGTEDKSKLVLWQDNNRMYWVDPASKEVQDYNIAIAKDALAHGFDEINFDYIRFPSDGKLKDMGFPFWDKKISRRLVIKDFFQRIRESLPDAKISVDLFGLTTVSNNDLGIGQVFEDSFDYFDYVSPMVYPSHYANGFMGYKNPAEYPYEVVKYSIDSAVAKRLAFGKNAPEKNLAKIRPWLQSFNMGAIYDAGMVKQQIKAVEDSMGEDFNGFMLWNPLNIYTKEAILLDKSTVITN